MKFHLWNRFRLWLHDGPSWLWRNNKIVNAISDAWYWFRSNTYNRYHIVDCRNKANGYKWGWKDRDQLLLFACFNILKDFVEKEYPGYVDWEHGEDISWAKQEMLELYIWWTQKRPAIINNKQTLMLHQEEEDSEMLKRLMRIRLYLWT